ncbi:MAG: M23 family metallopeptidase [Ardenticatenaceae bacterium]|nr:M23 family metallopeptidase [Ardenticatenaceae bacterium]
MSPSFKALLLPEWLRTWVQSQLAPVLGLAPQQAVVGVMRGVFDTLLLLLLGTGLLTGGRVYMDGQYALPRTIQATALKWAPIADQIARKADIPREVPLVLWFKENSMLAENPDSCTGIIGAYDLVRSGEHPCFTPGPISDLEVREQLTIAAQEFKERCPEITYWTHNPDTIKRCYLAYNAGAGAAQRSDPNESAYVMNNFDDAHQNMVYSDVELGTVRVTALGAWPTHLGLQSLIVTQIDTEERPLSLTLLDISTRLYDQLYAAARDWDIFRISGDGSMDFPVSRDEDSFYCLDDAHILGRPSLRPRLNPVTEDPILTQDVHGCSYGLPGLDISSNTSTAILQSPMSGYVTTYTDRWYNSTIRIENDEWIVWLLHPRSYLVEEGDVQSGQAVGVMGAVGIATGPHVHYTVYDKINETFVDPRLFLP